MLKCIRVARKVLKWALPHIKISGIPKLLVQKGQKLGRIPNSEWFCFDKKKPNPDCAFSQHKRIGNGPSRFSLPCVTWFL